MASAPTLMQFLQTNPGANLSSYGDWVRTMEAASPEQQAALAKNGYRLEDDGKWRNRGPGGSSSTVTNLDQWYAANGGAENQRKQDQQAFLDLTKGRGDAVMNDPRVNDALSRLQAASNAYRDTPDVTPMYRGDTILDDATSADALSILRNQATGGAGSLSNNLYARGTDATAAQAQVNADRLRDQAAQTGMSFQDPAFQAKLTAIDTNRQQANNGLLAQSQLAAAPYQFQAANQYAAQRLAQTIAAQQADMNYAQQVNNQGANRANTLAGLAGQQSSMALGQNALANQSYAQAASAYANATYSTPAGPAGYSGPPPVQQYQQPAYQQPAYQQPAFGQGQQSQQPAFGAVPSGTSGGNQTPSWLQAKPAAQAQAKPAAFSTPHDAGTMQNWANSQPGNWDVQDNPDWDVGDPTDSRNTARTMAYKAAAKPRYSV